MHGAICSAIVGVLVFFAGLDLLWQSRREAGVLVCFLYAHVPLACCASRNLAAAPFAPETEPIEDRTRRLPMVLGMGLAFVGPLLIAVSLTLILYPKL